MPLNEQQLAEILRESGFSEILKISRNGSIARTRASLTAFDVDLAGNERFSLLDKSVKSNDIPYENKIYAYFANKNAPIPKVYHNRYDPSSLEGILLLEDLSATHRNLSDWTVPLEHEQIIFILDAIAQFHVASWGKSDFHLPGHLENIAAYSAHLNYLEKDYLYFRENQPFSLTAEDFLPNEESLSYLRANAQRHVARIGNYTHTALIHGDLNVCNLLYPEQQPSRLYLIDLEAVRAGLCTEDLVMLFIHDLFHGGEETKRIFELYYQLLCDKGTVSYPWDQFIDDIKFSIREGIFFPLKLFAHEDVKEEELVWKSLTAYKSLIN